MKYSNDMFHLLLLLASVVVSGLMNDGEDISRQNQQRTEAKLSSITEDMTFEKENMQIHSHMRTRDYVLRAVFLLAARQHS